MPKEIKDVDRFVLLANSEAIEMRVKRVKDTVKLKLRTSKSLYTLKLDPESAEEIIKKIKCQVIEI
ncbi:MAG: 50S ribosomal protein L38e [Candidatus Helarchaeota archaeon]|nr:50S ribosomal protein L38e [Candidatus Helarchaeota archaeon]